MWVLAVALVVGVAAAFGGFKQRSDEKISVDAGTTVSLALADVRVMGATAKPTLDDSGNILPDGPWAVTVQAEIRATGRPVSSSSFSNAVMLGYVNGQGSQITSPTPDMFFMSTDDPTQASPRVAVPPSGQFVPVTFQVYVDDGLNTDQPLRVGLFPVVYGASSNAVGGNTYQTWLPDNSVHQFWVYALPIRVTES